MKLEANGGDISTSESWFPAHLITFIT